MTAICFSGSSTDLATIFAPVDSSPSSFSAALREASWLAHDAAFLIFAVAIIGHIYLGTAALPGTFRSMTRGTVTRAYARLHHPRWYRETTGEGKEGTVDGSRGPQSP